MAKKGRKTLFRESMVDEGYKLGALGLIMPEIANIWNVSQRALYRWEKRHPEFGQAIKRGREEADASVVQSLLKECREKGNITGIIFWLKNRQSHKWRDKIDIDETIKHINYSFNGSKTILSERDRGLLNVDSRN